MTTSTMSPNHYYKNNNINNINKIKKNNIIDDANKNVLNIIKNIQNNENCLNYSNEILKKMLLTIVNQVEKLFNRVNELENEVAELKTTKKNNNNLRQENQQLKCQVADFQEKSTPDQVCCVCMTNVRTHINTQCGHMSVCETCSYHLEEKCPICRANGNFIKVIVS
jgi:TolA-binding protein